MGLDHAIRRLNYEKRSELGVNDYLNYHMWSKLSPGLLMIRFYKLPKSHRLFAPMTSDRHYIGGCARMRNLIQ
jgi:hypothetical protein